MVAALVASVGAGEFASAGAGKGTGLDPGSFDDDPFHHLKLADARIDDALAAGTPRGQARALDTAEHNLNIFMYMLFAKPRNQTLYGCDSRQSLGVLDGLAGTDRLDVALELDAADRGSRLGVATGSAKSAFKHLRACSEVGAARAWARLILDTAAKLWERHLRGALSTEDLREGDKRIEKLKRKILEGHRLLSCDAYELVLAFEAVETRVLVGQKIEGFKKRSQQIRAADEALSRLMELWRSCGSDCTDTVDNDLDSLRDASDPGCLAGLGGAHDPRDMSENDFDPDADPPGIGCPTIPALITGFHNTFIRQPNRGDTLIGITLRNITTGAVVVERAVGEADFAAGGPIAVGDQICGPGTTASVEWSVDGLAVEWRILVAKNDFTVTPGVNRIVAAANTR